MHDHDHPHHHGGGHEHPAPRPIGPGHNRPQATTQWQVPHLPEGSAPPIAPTNQDLDLVEDSFVENFARASDPTSFLRLAGIPFVGVDSKGSRLHLLRVELEHRTDVGAISPLLGGEGMRYDPLPARLVSQRRRLLFIYHDGQQQAALDFAEARALKDQSAASKFAIASGGDDAL